MAWRRRFGLAVIVGALVAPQGAMGFGASHELPGTGVGEPGRYVVGLSAAPVVTPGDGFLGAKVLKVSAELKLVVVESDSPAALLAAARLRPEIRYVAADGEARAHSAPDDPLYDEQYGPQQVRAPEAWDLTTGGALRNVCIVDTGIQTTHEDLAGPRLLGGAVFSERVPWNPDGNLIDDNGHGTHVAGIAAATTDNGKGIAGVAQVGILGAKVLNHRGEGSWSDVALGIAWCADHGGDVISMSLGGGCYDYDGNFHCQAMEDAIAYAVAKGAVIVASAGNDGPCDECIAYPASHPEVVAVTCTDPEEEFCVFSPVGQVAGLFRESSRGADAELAAPGYQVLSTWTDPQEPYVKLSGTSMSAPHVAGVAALLWNAMPGLDRCQVRVVLAETAKDLGAPGRDPDFGYGLVDAKAALDFAASGPLPDRCSGREPVCRFAPTMGPELRGIAPVAVQSFGVADPVTKVKVWLEGGQRPKLSGPDVAGVFSGTVDSVAVADGAHDLVAECKDAKGRKAEARLPVTVDNTLRVRIDEPADTSLGYFGEKANPVSGIVPVWIDASSPRGDVLFVGFSVDGGPEQDVTAAFDGTHYIVQWDTTVLPETQFTLTARAVDSFGEELSDSVVVTVDNLPDPTATFVDPPSMWLIDPNGDAWLAAFVVADTLGGQYIFYPVAGIHRIKVEAQSGVGQDPRVEIAINGFEWIDITGNRDGDLYYYDWLTVSEYELSFILLRVSDAGGTVTGFTLVHVVGVDKVRNLIPDRVCVGVGLWRICYWRD